MTERPAVAVVGTGVIGASWAALFLAKGLVVHAYDPAPGAHDRLLAVVDEAWPALAGSGAVAEPPLEQLHWYDDVAECVSGTGFVQESGPERGETKQELVRAIDAAAPASTVVASSSSGLRPTAIQAACASHPERVLVGHPFHPAHLVPLVEVVPGAATSAHAVADAMAFYGGLGKRPIHVRQELDGHVVNRLQAALWREAYSLVDRGVVTVADVDAAITSGPGLRWAAVGPFAGQHLSGGDGGIAHTLAHLGPPMAAWWADLGDPELTAELVARVVAQTGDEVAATTVQRLSAARDRMLLAVIAARAAEPDLP